MADYLILKAGDEGSWAYTAVVLDVDPAQKADAARRGYQGPGRYAAVDWSARVEFDMTPGPITVTLRPLS